MNTKTRFVVITSALVMGVGLGVGLLAYSVGLPNGAFGRRGGPDELRFLPKNASLVGYANVHDVMVSDLRQRAKAMAPGGERGQEKFQAETGINIETDIDRVVASFDPGTDGAADLGVVIATGRFDETRIEALLRSHGAKVEDYKGRRLILLPEDGHDRKAKDADPGDAPAQPRKPRPDGAMAFIQPGTLAIGTAPLVRGAIDRRAGGENLTDNEDLMKQVRSLESGNAWAVGRFDALGAGHKLPAQVSSQLPPITWFSVSGHINGGLRGVLRAETRDDESANNLRDVLRGFMALAKMQAGGRPAMQTLLQSLELGGSGHTVALSFTVPADALELLGGPGGARSPRRGPEEH